MLQVTYGASKDEHIALAEAAGRSLSDALVPGAFLVDFIPLLRVIPEWVPVSIIFNTSRRASNLSICRVQGSREKRGYGVN